MDTFHPWKSLHKELGRRGLGPQGWQKNLSVYKPEVLCLGWDLSPVKTVGWESGESIHSCIMCLSKAQLCVIWWQWWNAEDWWSWHRGGPSLKGFQAPQQALASICLWVPKEHITAGSWFLSLSAILCQVEQSNVKIDTIRDHRE